MPVSGAALKAVFCSLIVLLVSLIINKADFGITGSVYASFIPLFLITAGCCRFLHYNPQKAIITAPVFSVIQGVILGLLAKTPLASILPRFYLSYFLDEGDTSFMQIYGFDKCYFGEAFFNSACIIIVMSLLCIVNNTHAEQFKVLISVCDILGVLLFYLANISGVFFISAHNDPTSYLICGIGNTLSCLPVAYCLALDFASIRAGSLSKVPQYMEWYCAFALIFTLTWSYFELFRLLRTIIREAFTSCRH